MTSAAPALLRLARPKQWAKNLLVVGAPLAAGKLLDPGVLASTLVAFVAFCAVSSAVYSVNDCLDRELDRLHPTKCRRPVASGEVGVPAAMAMAAILAVAGLAVGALGGRPLLACLAAYVAVNLAYVLWLKHETVVDLMVVATGFLLRAVAGGLAASLPISQWFLLVAGFGSLFIVSGKRYSELQTVGSAAGTRRSLLRYTASYLRFVWSIAAASTAMSYSLWAFQMASATGVPWHTISIAPFVMVLLRYAVDIDAGRAGEPEDIVWSDHGLQIMGAVWLVTVTTGVLHG